MKQEHIMTALSRLALFALAPVLAMQSAAALADTSTGTVGVSATVTAACFIGDGTLAFGNVPSISESATQGQKANSANADADTGAISYVCSNGATASLGLSSGNAATSQLRMKNGANNYLSYDLYQSAADRTAGTPKIVPASGGSPSAISLTADGNNQTITLYGRVPGANLSAMPAGAYTDTLTLTVTY